jgi:hypothetical protein
MQCDQKEYLQLRSRVDGALVVASKKEKDSACYDVLKLGGTTRWGKEYCGECDWLGGYFIGHFVSHDCIYVLVNGDVALLSEVDLRHQTKFGRSVLELVFPNGKEFRISYRPLVGWLEWVRLLISYHSIDVGDVDYGAFLGQLKQNEQGMNIVVESYRK